MPLVAALAARFCWICMGGGGRWWDGIGNGGCHAANPTHGAGIFGGVLRRHHVIRGNSMDSTNLLANREGRAEKQLGRRIAWHLVGAAVSVFVALASLSIAWAGFEVQYQARVEREQLQMLARPQQPSPTDSSVVFFGSWHNEVMLP